MTSIAPDVLLVGSSPFQSTEEFISSAARPLSKHLRRIPDGETGQRSNFIQWQHLCLPLELIQPRWGGQPSMRNSSKKYTLEDIKPVGYDDQAIASYATFHELKASGVIPADVRFQVCLPTPAGVVRGLIVTQYCSTVEPLYEERFVRAIHRIQEHIPVSELSIQFDLPFEIAMLEVERGRLQDPESYWSSYFSPVKAGILERVVRLVKLIKPGVEIGLHLCYGDYERAHFVEPADMGLLVEVANETVKATASIHEIGYIHMPVPKNRDDEGYYKPLEQLVIGHSQLVLGLVHPHDESGTRRRIEVASSSCPVKFGLSTECGLGRATIQEVESIFDITASVLADAV
ncbi:MAG: hypothetical protein Q9219_005525 [cf. Caloplaca sp. 3 TL-2023]